MNDQIAQQISLALRDVAKHMAIVVEQSQKTHVLLERIAKALEAQSKKI